jgi:hypothetical protein
MLFPGAEGDLGIGKGGKQGALTSSRGIIAEKPLEEAQPSLGTEALPGADGTLDVPEQGCGVRFVTETCGRGGEVQETSQEPL